MNRVNAVLAGVGGYLVALLGGVDSQLQALIIIIVCDFLTGAMTAIAGKSPKSKNGYLSSMAMTRGLFKKIAYMICVIIAVLLENCTGLEFIRQIVIISFVITECLSVLENCGRLGVRCPDVLYRALDVLKDKEKK